MPNTHSTLTALFSDIADSIRSKAGTSAPIVADAFPAAIDAIPSGGGGDSAAGGIIDRTISGAYTNASVSSIGSYALAYCSSLTKVSFPVCTTIGFYAFRGCTSLTEASLPVCRSIDASAFYSCSSLTKATFPVCATIGAYAFYGCTSLTEATFPVCTTIGASAFYNCPSLTEVSLPVCRSIAAYAFYNCRSLTEVSLPVCMSIAAYAFRSCNKLLSLYLLGSSVPYLSNITAFDSTPISNYTTATGGVYGSIIVQESMLSAFQIATNWSVYSSRFSVWNGID